MRIEEPLLEATLLRRYQRFLADVRLADGKETTVHCPNPGRMTSCCEPGRPVLISDSGNPRRKLRYTLEMIRMGRTWVGVNTSRPNRVVRHLVERGRIPELAGYGELRTEVPYGRDGRSRIDLLLRHPARPDCYVEVKNTTLRLPLGGGAAGRGRGVGAFPDAVTVRGRKHLEELRGVVEDGGRGVLFFFVGRADCHRFRPADDVDPDYGEALRTAAAAGVELLAYSMRFRPQRIDLLDRLPIDL